MLADAAADLHVLVTDSLRLVAKRFDKRFVAGSAGEFAHAFDSPAQVDRSRPGLLQRIGRGQHGHARRVRERRKVYAPGSRRPDQGRAAHVHVGNRGYGVLPGAQVVNPVFVREAALVDDVERAGEGAAGSSALSQIVLNVSAVTGSPA